MPIIIHRGPNPQQATAANDWDKDAGLVIMIVAAVLALQELFFEGLLIALFNWEPVRNVATDKEIREVKDILALFVLHTMVLGLMNALIGWGIYCKTKWAFLVGPLLNISALIGLVIWAGDPGVEQAAFAILLSGYCLVRLFGALGPKP
jgi:hypothetical protein